MNTYRVNQSIYYPAFISLILLIFSGSAMIFLIATRNPYWFYSTLGIVFLFQWISIAGVYPRKAIVQDKNITFVMATGKKINVSFEQLRVKTTPSSYALEFRQNGATQTIKLAKTNLPDELTSQLDEISDTLATSPDYSSQKSYKRS